VSAKQEINDKLQCSHNLKCGGVVNNQIKKGLLLSLWAKKYYKIGEYLAKLDALTWLSRALSSSCSRVLARRAKCMRQPQWRLYSARCAVRRRVEQCTSQPARQRSIAIAHLVTTDGATSASVGRLVPRRWSANETIGSVAAAGRVVAVHVV